MKNILRVAALSICAIFMAANASAQTITAERAQEIANQFFSNGKQKSAALRSTSATLVNNLDSHAITGESDDAPTFHILTGTGGKGFVIVSGEEIENPIIGYSFDGTINTGELSTGLTDYLTDIDAQVKALRKSNAANPQKAAAARTAMQKASYDYNATSMGNIVVELNTAQWAQSSPYNNYCTTTDGAAAKTGCVPTAYSILCYYHKWPESANAVKVYHSGSGASMTLGHTYDYESMANVSTEAGANAVATLMRDLGWAYQVDYGTSTTGTGIKGEAVSTLIEVFKYKSETPRDHGNYTTTRATLGNDELWIQYIKESLDANLPIPYSSTTSASSTARHIYILDGYTSNNYFHFNWGWGGNGNGWFTLDNMVVDTSSDYSNSHKAYFKVMPDKTTSTPDPEPETPTTCTVTTTANPAAGGSAKFAVGTGSQKTQGDVESGTQITLYATANTGYNFVNWTLNGAAVSTDATCNVSVSQTANYVANFEAVQQSYPSVDGQNYTNNYLTSAATTGAIENVTYSASSHPGVKLVTVPGTVRVEKGESFTLNLVAKSLSTSTSSVAEDMRYCHATLYTDFDQNYTFEEDTKQRWGEKPPTNNVAGNYSTVMNISATIDVPANAPLGTSHVRMIYTNAWTNWPTNGTTTLDKGIVYDFVVEVVETATITASASTGGTVKINNEAIETKKVVKGSEVTLTATSQNGYEFVNWTKNGAEVSTEATYTFNAAETASYVANFQAVSQTDPLAGKYFRLKDKGTGKYMNVADNSEHTSGAYGGVSVATLDENSNAQIFFFEANGDGYKLKDKNGYYIKGQEWNIDAISTDAANGSVLLFEETATVNEYYIKWNNTTKGGIKYFKVGLAQNTSNYYPYCDADDANAAATWVLEEVVTTPEPEQPQELFPDGAYKVYWQADNRGYLAYHATDYPDEAKLAGVTYPDCATLHYNVDEVDLVWYLITASDGKRYLFEVATGKFLGVDTSVQANGTGNKLSTSEAWAIAVEPNTNSTRLGHYIITTMISGTKNLLCSGCGTPKAEHPVRWLPVNDNNQKDGGAPLQLVKVDNVTVNDNVMSAVRAVIEPRTFHFKAVVEGWRDDNPNTHLGTITIGGTPMKLTPEHLTTSELTMPLNEGSALAFTRKYRGFEFNGFYIGTTELGATPTLAAENIAAINETTPLIAKFTATNDVTLFYDDDEFSYRIPAIAKTSTNHLIAISDYRHSHDDIGRDNHHTGTLQVDLVMRTSEDNGLTWTDKVTIAEGNQNFGYGDAAVAVNGENILVMAVAGNVFFANANATNKQRTYRIYRTDNGQTWEKEEVSSNLYDLFPNANGMFFGSGKLVVDPNFNDSGNARVYGAMLLNDGNNYVLYSDDWGATWNILGGRAAASANEPKVEILPNGQILLSSRRSGGRTFNVFTYTNKATSEGSWDSATNGCNNGGNATNGEIICLDAKRPNGQPTKILLQSQPNGSDRRNVSIWYKELTGDNFTASDIANGWTMGKQVSTQLSAYSAMCLQENGEIALFFEEAPCHNDDATYGYSMVYVPLTIEEATGDAFLNPNADVEYVPVEFNVELTDAQGNIYRETLDYIPDDVAAALTAKYPFITLGENGVTADNKYTNTVTLPFKVSNADTTTWYNIYWPANTGNNGYPVYLSASSATDSNVPKVTEAKVYGESSYNTLQNGDKIAWAIYNVNNSFEFIFKNKLTNNYIKAESVATGGAQNVKYVAEDNATAFTLLKDTGTYKGDFALVANINGTTGYLCSTSATGYHYATHFNGNGHEGAWVVFKKAPDYQAIVDELTENINKFGTGEGNYTDNNDIDAIKAIIENIRTTPLNSLNTHTTTVQNVKNNYAEITLTIPVANSGSVKIKEEPVSNKFVPKGSVTIEAVPAAGYYFVNWTKPAAQASAAARAAQARSAVEVVSADNPYTFDIDDAVSLTANFEQIVVTATLKDERENVYIATLSGFTGDIDKATVEAKLREKYPYITLGNEVVFSATEYTYSNRVELPFKVSNPADESSDNMWHNIYYPSNNKAHSGYPNYIAALNEDEIVDMAASPNYAYGDNPDYNTLDNGDNIAWAIYNVNNSFEFIFKSKHTGKYIKVESVVNATGNTQNVKFVDNAEDATAFTLLKDTSSYNGDFALVANVDGTTGYLCATSSDTNYITHFDRNNHQGAWVKFAEANYEELVNTIGQMLYFFGTGNNRYMQTANIQEINDAFGTYENPTYQTILLNTLKASLETIEDAINNWPMVSITIAPENCGTTSINGEENVTKKYVPTGSLPLVAVPAEGYHFVSWTDGTNEITTAEYTKTISGGKDDVITLTANFAKNSYNISVLAGEGGSAYIAAPGTTNATVEHGNEVTLTAVANDGYRFVNWTKGTDVVSTNATYTFPVTADGEYVANFELSNTPVTHYDIIVNANIEGEGIAFIETGTSTNVTSGRYESGAAVTLTAVSDKDENGYLFVGWYTNGELISTKKTHTITLNSNATYTAVFEEGWRVRYSCNYRIGGIQVFDEEDNFIGGTEYVLVKKGSTIKMLGVPGDEYEFKDWTDGIGTAGNFVSSDNPYIFTVEGNITLIANFEPVHYVLTVRANDDSYGTVTAESGEFGPASQVKVGYGMIATITATANEGYKFVNWTKGTETVSYEATYTIPAINDVNNMEDVEYIAHFIEIEEAEPGTYYRIAYEFSTAAAASAARAGATRAAGDTYTYVLTPQNIGLSSGSTSSFEYTGTNPVALSMTATNSNGAEVATIGRQSTSMFKLYAYYQGTSTFKYSLSAPDGYKITEYSFEYKDGNASYPITLICNDDKQITEPATSTDYYVLSVTPNKQTAEFTLQTSATTQCQLLVKNFTVTIQEVGSGEGEGGEVGGGETPETPETPVTPSTEKYYMQSVACGVTNKTNALKMTQETGAASIFYYADSKLLSYDKGTYLNEVKDMNGASGARGLQDVGVAGGDVQLIDNKIKVINGETSTVFLHANQSGTTYFVDRCGTDNCGAPHNFIIEEVESLPVTIGAALHATFYAPVAVTIPEGVVAFVLKEKNITAGSYVTLTRLRNGIIPANTGVILKTEAADTYNFNITDNTDEARGEVIGNILEGTVAKSRVTKDAYMLAKKNGVVGMYPLSNNSYLNDGTTPATFINNSHKAYLPVEGNFATLLQQSVGFRFIFDDETTEIEEIETEVEDTIYDLQGRKLSEITQPGIYIVNGKKIFVK